MKASGITLAQFPAIALLLPQLNTRLNEQSAPDVISWTRNKSPSLSTTFANCSLESLRGQGNSVFPVPVAAFRLEMIWEFSQTWGRLFVMCDVARAHELGGERNCGVGL